MTVNDRAKQHDKWPRSIGCEDGEMRPCKPHLLLRDAASSMPETDHVERGLCERGDKPPVDDNVVLRTNSICGQPMNIYLPIRAVTRW